MLAFMVAGALMAVTSEPTDADVATLAGKKPGYWINLDGKTYHDLNECQGEANLNGILLTDFEHGCEDICNNICDGYVCSCERGRKLDDDQKSCYSLQCENEITVQLDGEGEVGYPFCSILKPRHPNSEQTVSLETLKNGEATELNCSTVHGNYTEIITVSCEKGKLRPDMSKCEEVCVPGEWKKAPGAECTQNCTLGDDKGQMMYVREIIKGQPDCADTFKFDKCDSSDMKNCPIDCKLGDWGDFGPCSNTCGCGVKEKRREVIAEGKYGGKPCPPKSELVEYVECETDSDCTDVEPVEPDPSKLAKEPKCEWQMLNECCYPNLNALEEYKTVEPGQDHAGEKKFCEKKRREVPCVGLPSCGVKAQIFRDTECFDDATVSADAEIEVALEKVEEEPHCRYDNNLKHPIHDCLQWAMQLTSDTAVSNGGLVIFNYEIVEDRKKCCFFLQEEGSTIQKKTNKEKDCYAFLPEAKGWFGSWSVSN